MGGTVAVTNAAFGSQVKCGSGYPAAMIETESLFRCGGRYYVRTDIKYFPVNPTDKLPVWLHGEVKSPPFSRGARLEAGFHLRRLQRGERLEMRTCDRCPASDCAATRWEFMNANSTWRVVYRVDPDAVVIVEVFKETSPTTPQPVVEVSRKRLREYDDA